MRKISIALSSALVLVLALAATALGHHVISIGCDENDIEVVANVFDNHVIVVTIDGNEVLNEAVPGGNADHTWTFPYGGGPAEVVVSLWSGQYLEDQETEEVNCYTPQSVPQSVPQSIPQSVPQSQPEGSQAGGTGTPAQSLVDSATSPTSTGSALVTIGFAMILVASLGTLAYANVRAGRR